MLRALFLFTILLMSFALPGDQPWKLWRDQDGIEVYSRSSSNGYDEVHATTRVKTTLSAFIALLHDTAHVPDWMESVRSVTVIQDTGPRSNIVHTRFQAPWPVANRDMVTSSEYSQPDPCSLVLNISDRHGDVPELAGHIRMVDVRSQWRLTAQADGHVEIDYQAHADTSGHLPQWMANRAALQMVFRTFQGLRRELANSLLQEKVIDGISECPAEK